MALATLAELLKIPAAEPGPLVSGVTHAGDEVLPGDLYAALPGSRRHGAEFIGQAAEAGAVAVLTDPAGAEMAAAAGLPALVVDDPRAVLGIVADRVYGEPSRDLVLIGITGTAGKTSTAYLVESGLRAAGHVTGVIGTVETRLGDLTIKSKRTTPEATDLHALLAVARENGVTAVVMEVSSHALALGRVGGVRFAVAGWTNFGLDHLDFHATTEEYFAAKASLFDGRARSEVLNLDDPALTPLIKPTTITYSASGNTSAIWYAQGISGGYDQQFTAYGPGGAPVRAGVALAGRHNVANALLALASLTEVGVDPQTAADGIAACPGVPGRLERVAGPVNTRRDIVGVVDYAHKPDAIVAALKALRELAEYRHGRLICVIGAGGDRDRGKRPIMGKAAADGSDLLIVTDDNPRTEDPAQVRAEVIAGVPNPADVIEIAGRRTAIDEAVRLARTGDVIAVLGKGHETGQEVGDEVLPFDDRVELADALTAAALAEGESA
ncbi:UDP-N-acetylmuramoyl-L-alanyl-D-glutamate--2,6-diaminopimelate ligase [Hamadaea sp.]|uniref:UDP-N-acetylmuramoyl-L-alanyl-D-glutamate--2, 6-diaminopimelate ligase n=1 Tax=Hamadaea sp. TaxID=2024425 RepID=UPI0025BD4303|nr:UDP-N-acetylmuramoyl-L-alanyl-D-glutamate--2,6-diaminopimelate ligase [Hamadaea sp.]